MRAIFISYRRDDSEGHAGRLFEALVDAFGADAVFMDVTGIEPGRDFRKVIDEYTASCRVLLALIGKSWLGASDDAGGRRLDDPMDFVRLETASALRRDIAVIPVLVQGAHMPKAEQLPDDLKELVFRNNVELTHARWDSDVQVLIRGLRPLLQAPPDTGSAPRGPNDVDPDPARHSTPDRPPSPAPAPAPAPAHGKRGPGLAIALALAVAGLGVGGYLANGARQQTEAEDARKAQAERAAQGQAEDARKAEAARAAEEARKATEAETAARVAREARASEQARRAGAAPTQRPEEVPALPNLSGWWRDNLGTVSQIAQTGSAFRFAAEGTSCNGGLFQSAGAGTVTGNSVQSTYQSNLPSRGSCSGNVSSDGTRVTSTCTDSVCGTFVSSAVRQR